MQQVSIALTKGIRISSNMVIRKPMALVNSVEQLVLRMAGVKVNQKPTILSAIRVFAQRVAKRDSHKLLFSDTRAKYAMRDQKQLVKACHKAHNKGTNQW